MHVFTAEGRAESVCVLQCEQYGHQHGIEIMRSKRSLSHKGAGALSNF